MAENGQCNQPKKDEEYALNLSPKAIPKRRSIKCFGLIIAGVLLQVVLLGVLAVTVFRFKDPDLKLRSISIHSLIIVTGSPASLNLTLKEEIAVKNQNWGQFKFDQSSVNLTYKDAAIGEGKIPSGKVKMRHTGVLVVLVEAKFEVKSEDLIVNSYTELSGKVNMLKMVKKRRTGRLNCSVTIGMSRQTIQDYKCRH